MSEKLIGIVKWFDNRSGYGFVTVVGEGDRAGEDVFVHHTNVSVGTEQYKYLVQGEYVSFNVTETEDDSHKVHGTDITGVWGGKLMCETRHENRREDDENGPRHGGGDTRHGGGGGTRHGGNGPREGARWMLVQPVGGGGGRGGTGRRGGRRPPRQPRVEVNEGATSE